MVAVYARAGSTTIWGGAGYWATAGLLVRGRPEEPTPERASAPPARLRPLGSVRTPARAASDARRPSLPLQHGRDHPGSIQHRPAPHLPGGPLGTSRRPPRIADPAHPERPAGATYLATEAQLEEAIEAAGRGFEVMRRLPAFERGRALHAISAEIAERRDELAETVVRESGKPIRDARTEVDRGAFVFRLAGEESERMVGETIPLDVASAHVGRIGVTRRFPIGPVAGISPFNFPLNLAAHKVAPAIAAGCSNPC